MNTLRQFLHGQNLFDEIKAVYPYPFIFDEINMMFIIDYGDMPLYSALKDIELKDIATMLDKIYREKWLTLLDLSGDLFDSISVTKKIEVSETIDNSETRQENRGEIESVSAYNDDDLVTDSGRDTETSGTTSEERERIMTRIESDLKAAFDRLPLMNKTNIIKTAMTDIANFLKIAIY